ncbi:GDSL-type esterase/lipase family protein [Crocosphaera sp. UHCC 0190]|uniref:GDSL-type esterase/lipase family protein n=1 Tax=Crocosphaera sp. UHCC 0190 TaxID=3110246 RepID=UPI002B22048E|nr:GDSL-type esterase/lipase family protein [Crocosphaera sp. UHCC 0190]MEA5508497.1 GDSL-type esterase/lipase family protein [Crocosphaera sp. UHCC 0190]
MSNKTRNLLYLSLSINFIFVILTTTFLIRKGGIYYLAKKLQSLNSIRQQTELSSKSKPRRQTYQGRYYQAKSTIFQQLPNSNQEIIFLGDSLTDQGEWSEILQNSKVINRGISGDTTEGVLNRFDEIIAAKPKKIFLMIGTNDIWNEQKTVDEIIINYRNILNIIKTQSPQTKVYIQSLLPVNNLKYNIKINNDDVFLVNDNLKKLAQEFNYQYIDLSSSFLDTSKQLNPNYTYDGVHLNGKGYLLWGKLIKNHV